MKNISIRVFSSESENCQAKIENDWSENKVFFSCLNMERVKRFSNEIEWIELICC